MFVMYYVRDSSEKLKLSPFSRAYLITTTTTEMIKGASIGFSRTVSKIGTAVGQLLKAGSSPPTSMISRWMASVRVV